MRDADRTRYESGTKEERRRYKLRQIQEQEDREKLREFYREEQDEPRCYPTDPFQDSY